MRQIYHHYEQWEDFHAGLYRTTIDGAAALINAAQSLLSDQHELGLAMMAVTDEWPIASEVNLTNMSRNRRAWLGQAACCYAHQVPEDLTKLAWHRLTNAEQIAANSVADDVIARWERQYREKGGSACLKPGWVSMF